MFQTIDLGINEMNDFEGYIEAIEIIGKLKKKTLENYLVDYNFPNKKEKVSEKECLCQELRDLSLLFCEHWKDKFGDIDSEVNSLARHACFPKFGGNIKYRNRYEFFQIITMDLPQVEKKLNQQFEFDFETD
jgi:hypothetical protein